MPDYSYPIYDTALFGTTDNTTHVLFQIGEGGDATHVSDFTNMRGNGTFPQLEKFLIRKIGIMLETNATESDAEDWTLDGFLRMYLSNQIIFQAPLQMLVMNTSYSGHFTQAAAATRALIGRDGMGYMVDPMVLVRGGEAFKVEVYQGTVVAAANTRVKVILDGVLTRPEIGR